jgi:hypothetical protein
VNRSRAKRRLNAWRWYAQRARELTANWWEDDSSTNGYVLAFRRWRWHAGAERSRSWLPWNRQPGWAKNMPASFVLKVRAEYAELRDASDDLSDL